MLSLFNIFHFYRFINGLIEEFRANTSNCDVEKLVRKANEKINRKLSLLRRGGVKKENIILSELTKIFNLKKIEALTL